MQWAGWCCLLRCVWGRHLSQAGAGVRWGEGSGEVGDEAGETKGPAYRPQQWFFIVGVQGETFGKVQRHLCLSQLAGGRSAIDI